MNFHKILAFYICGAIIKKKGDTKMRWLLIRIPVTIYVLVMLWLFSLSSTHAFLLFLISLIFVILWLLFAKWVCKEWERHK